MQQTFEYYTVNPGTWKDDKKLTTVKSCTITRDDEAETLGSATINVTESVGECYIRAYLITVQNGITEKHPLGTFLVQTPSSSFDGKIREVSLDAYTPLLELKENPPPLGYSLLKDSNIMSMAYMLTREHARAPVVKTECDSKLNGDFVANLNDTWITFLSDLIVNAKYSFGLDELGRIIFVPEQDLASLQPVWTYTDGDESILYHEVTMDHDLYGIPNVVEVVYSTDTDTINSRVVNNDENSPVSTVNRGREIIYRDTNPALDGIPSQIQLDEYATKLLRALSTVKYTVSYSHGYCPVRLGDCVRLNYTRAGLIGIKAKVINQSIDCSTGCRVSEKAVFTNKLWG
jgi:hypothetical protein